MIRKTARFHQRHEGLDAALAAIGEFRNAQAERVHASSKGVERFTSLLYPLGVEPVEFNGFRTVATTESKPS